MNDTKPDYEGMSSDDISNLKRSVRGLKDLDVDTKSAVLFYLEGCRMEVIAIEVLNE